MKKLFTWLTPLFVAANALAQSVSFSTNITVNTAIPDNNPSGLASSFSLNGFNSAISNITVSIDVTGGYNGDLYAYLTGPGGFAVLLNRTGVGSASANGYGDTGFAVTFMSAGLDIHNYGAGSYTTNSFGQLTGNWGVDGRAISPFSTGSAFDTAPRTALLDSFLGTSPNGTWGFFIADYSPGNVSTLVSYSVSIATVPEPGVPVLLALGGMALLVTVRRWKASAK